MEGIRIFLKSHNEYPTVSWVQFRTDFLGTFPDFSGGSGVSNRLRKMGKWEKWFGHCICSCFYFCLRLIVFPLSLLS
jgi:hypothetical protein